MQYYVFPAPKSDLFRDLYVDDLATSTTLPFVNMKCTAVKYQKGMTLDQVRQKIRVRWLEELSKFDRREVTLITEEIIEMTISNCIHGYIVLDDTARMLLKLKRSHEYYVGASEEKILPFISQRLRQFSYLNMLFCLHSEGTFVEILTDGRESWLTSENDSMRTAALMMSRRHTISNRLIREKGDNENVE